jgi:hypothetical protein
MKIKQIYHPYYLWEDYINGMWKKANKLDEQDLIKKATEFMSDNIKFGNAMINVVDNWKYTCEHNLTDPLINHKAFIGQTAVCYELKIPEYITRIAWSCLTEKQQFLANKQASKAINKFKLNHKKLNNVIKELFE